MAMDTPIATAANKLDRKLTIVNPKNLYDPSPNGYSTAVITQSTELKPASWPAP
jgi:hypothetical protein